MTRQILLIACVLLMACAPSTGTIDPRATSLVGAWCLRMDRATPAQPAPSCASVALVAVRHDAPPAPDERTLLAEGAISLLDISIGERLPDGTPMNVHSARGDSVMLGFASPNGDFQVYLTGMLQGDTLRGRWRSILGRSGGSNGTFVMTRLR